MKFFQSFYLTHFSKPASNRAIYRYIQSEHPRKILEIGIQRAERTLNMIQMLLKYCGEKSDAHYCCIDPFEARTTTDGPGLSLRKTHRLVNKFGIQTRLIPLPPANAIRQLHLNRQIEKVDLAVIAMPDMKWLPGCVSSLCELIHESASIFFGVPGLNVEEGFTFEKIDLSDLHYIAAHDGLLPGRFKHAA